MRSVRYKRTLFYYDGPVVFEAHDNIGGHYIAVAAPAGEKPLDSSLSSGRHERFLVVGVNPERLRLFRVGEIDLHSLLLDSEESDRYIATMPNGVEGPLHLERLSGPLPGSGMLPERGFVLHDDVADGLVKEARERNNLVLEIVANPPEAASQHRIHASTLAGLLQHMQTMVRRAHCAWRKENQLNAPKPSENLLDVAVPAAPGSFRVLLEAAGMLDLLGESEIGRSLPRVDGLFEHAARPDDVASVVKDNRGHLAGAYLKFLRFLHKTRTGIRYSWALPDSEKPTVREVPESQISPLVNVLSRVQKIGREPAILEGMFEKFNRNTGVWGLRTDDGCVHSGKIGAGELSLDGLEVGSPYRFHCDAEIEVVDITGEERHIFHLNRHERL